MFSWICPKCGKDVPPSYTECPNCAALAATASVPPPQAAAPPAGYPPPNYPPPPPPGYPSQQYPPQYGQQPYPQAPPNYPPPPGYPQQQYPPQYAQPYPPQGYAPPPPPAPVAEMPPPEQRRPPKPAGFLFGGQEEPVPPSGYPAPPTGAVPPPMPPRHYAEAKAPLPQWLVMLGVATVVGLIIASAVWWKQRSAVEPAPVAAVEPGAPAAATNAHPLSKLIELSGFRLAEDKSQKASVKMLIINHSTADTGQLDLSVTLKAANAKAGDTPLATFDVRVPAIEPLGTREVSTPIKTTLRAYELPDWQFIRAEFQIK